eukprot:scaffold10013_cov79-Skeletonema_dohrnii-CCMP3373.AAC.17
MHRSRSRHDDRDDSKIRSDRCVILDRTMITMTRAALSAPTPAAMRDAICLHCILGSSTTSGATKSSYDLT